MGSLGGNPWLISGEERNQHDSQFFTLKPINGELTGEQARGLFIQSGLPSNILAQIWGMSDLNQDGKMNKKEFSIAMHLIQKKLQGFTLPTSLPDSLKRDPQPAMIMMAPPGRGMVHSGGGMMIRPPAMGGGVVPSPGRMGYGVPAAPGGMMPPPGSAAAQAQPGAIINGVHARNILTQSGLPNPILAQIWSLSDIDKDGRLTSDEFCIAMHLVDLVRMNVTLPATIPPILIPRTRGLSESGSVDGAGLPPITAPGGTPMTPAAMQMQMQQPLGASPLQPGGFGSAGGDVQAAEQDTGPASMFSLASFEEKRKQNFDKGAAVLAQKRALLQEQEKREREERERKYREAEEKRERERLEMERRRQLEMEKQMAKQRELEMERQEEQRRMMEQREAARREMERQRQEEEERQRVGQLTAQRQREQEALCQTRQKHKNLTFQLQALGEKSTEMNTEITTMRDRIVEITGKIEGMKCSRDEKVRELERLKSEAEQKQQRLSQVGHEKYHVMSQARQSQAGSTDPIAESLRQVEQSFSNKTMNMATLSQTLENIQSELSQKKTVTEERKTYLTKVQSQLSDLTDTNRELHTRLLAKQREAREALENHRKLTGTGPTQAAAADPDPFAAATTNVIGGSSSNSGFAVAFGDGFGAAAFGAVGGGFGDDGGASATTRAASGGDATGGGNAFPGGQPTVRYRALFEFVARSNDELSFQPGDIILVFPDNAGTAEPGWLAGQIRDQVGWFPEQFAEKIVGDGEAAAAAGDYSFASNGAATGGDGTAANAAAAAAASSMKPLPSIDEESAVKTSESKGSMSATGKGTVSSIDDGFEKALALYSWKAKTDTHLTFQKGETIRILEKQEMWWKGANEAGAEGFFPKSYVRLMAKDGSGSGSKQRGTSMDGSRSQTPGSPPKTPDEEPKDSAALVGQEGTWYISLYPFAAPEPGDLRFEANQRILVVKQDGDWWTGRIDGGGSEEGIFPSSYVQLLETEVLQQKSAATPSNADSTERELEVGKAIARFPGTAANQLTLQPGDFVRIRTKSPNGWWEGELAKKGQEKKIGWFPGNYVKVLAPSETGSIDGGSSLGGGSLAGVAGAGAGAAFGGLDLVVTAAFDYTAQQSDELSFVRGAQIKVLDKSEGDWWRGRLIGGGGGGGGGGGAEGIFPAAYVQDAGEGGAAYEPAAAVQAEAVQSEQQQQDQQQHQRWETKQQQQQIQQQQHHPPPQVPSHRTSLQQQDLSEPTMKKGILYRQELVQSELNYLKDLKMVMAEFGERLKDSGVVTAVEYRLLFGDWDALIGVSHRFYMDLKDRMDQIADVILAHMSDFRAFLSFSQTHQQSIDLLEKKEKLSPQFRTVHREACSQERVRGLSLSYFLLLPITRVTKYPLVLEKIIKYAPANEVDSLQTALNALRSLVEDVNKGMSQIENYQMLYWCQEHVRTDGVIRPKLTFHSQTNRMGLRKFVHSGVLYKAKSGRLIIGLLFNDFLMLTTPDESIEDPEGFKLSKNSADLTLSLYKTPIFLHTARILSGFGAENNSQQQNESHHQQTSANSPAGGSDLHEVADSPFTIEARGTSDILVTVKAVSVNARTLWIKKLETAIAESVKPTTSSQQQQANAARRGGTTSTPTSGGNAAGSGSSGGGIGRLLVEVICVRQLEFPPDLMLSTGGGNGGGGGSGSAGGSLPILNCTMSLQQQGDDGEDGYFVGDRKTTTAAGKKPLKQSKMIDINQKDPLWNTQFMIDSDRAVLHFSLHLPQAYSPDICAGRLTIPVQDLLLKSSSHRGAFCQQYYFVEEDGRSKSNSYAILKFVVHLLN